MPPNIKRLQKEMKEMETDPPVGCTAGPIDVSDMTKWRGVITGPAGTPYENGTFQLDIDFPADYPFKPPLIKFVTKIYHPNIASDGSICLDILKKEWSPILTISKVLLSISSLLSDANPKDPLNQDAARDFLEHRDQFDQKVREMVAQQAQLK